MNDELRKKALERLNNQQKLSYEEYVNNVEKAIEQLNIYNIELEIQTEELEKTNEKLQQLEKKYEDLFFQSPLGYITISENFEIKDLNQKAIQLLNSEKHVKPGHKLTEYIHEGSQDKFHLFMSNVIKQNYGEEELQLTKKEKPVWVQITGKTIQPSYEKDTLIQLVLKDISEEKETRQKLEDQYKYINTIINHQPEAVVIQALNNKISDCNIAFLKLIKYHDKAEPINKNFEDFFPQKIKDDIKKRNEQLVKTGHCKNLLITFNNNNEEETYIEISSNIIRNSDHPVKDYIIHNLKDVSELMITRSTLKESSSRYKNITENADLLICELDNEGKFQFVNHAYERILGYKPKDLQGINSIDIMHPDDAALLNKDIQKLLKSGKSSVNQWRFKHKNGEWLTFKSKSNLIVHENGQKSIIIISDDLTQQLRDRQAKKESEQLYKTLSENIPSIAMLMFDTDDVCVAAAGRELRKQLHFKHELIGKKMENIMDDRLVDFIKKLYKSVLKNVVRVSSEYQIDNSHYNIQLLSLYSHRDDDYKMMVIFQNITEDKRTENRLLKAKKSAETANNAKTEFLGNMSHEIRTPLNAILGFSEQLYKTKLTSRQQAYIDTIHSSSLHLQKIVNETLTITQIESGKIKLSEEPVNFNKIIKEVYEITHIAADKKGIVYDYSIEPALERTLIGDELHIRQIFLNIANNAIKFTEKGYVKIVASIKEENKKEIIVKTDIIDTGIGISEKQQKELFKKFEQANRNILKKYGGSGLGLAISKKLAEMQGGDIALKSYKGKGTILTLTLPLKKLTGKTAEKLYKDIEIEPALIKDKKFLVVDDDENNLLLMQIIFNYWKLPIDIARNGKEAIRKIKNKEYDLVFMDIQMLEMNGINATIKIREEMNIPPEQLPILAVTANALKKEIKEYLNIGMNDYIIKPFKEKEVFTAIIKNLGIEPCKEINSTKPESNTNANENHDLYDLTELNNATKGNKEFFNQMIHTFIHNTKEGMANIEKLYKNKQWQKIGEAAHKMKPSFQHIGANKGVELLKKIEYYAIKEPNYKEIPKNIETLASYTSKLISNLKSEIKS